MKVATKIKLPVQIKHGKFASNLPTINEIMKAYEGHTIMVTFEKRRNKRSISQNNYYHGVIVPIWGNIFREEWNEIKSLEEVHGFLKVNYNFEEKYNEKSDKYVRIVKSTTDNSVVEQEVYHKRCRDAAYELFNVIIPLPDTEMEIQF